MFSREGKLSEVKLGSPRDPSLTLWLGSSPIRMDFRRVEEDVSSCRTQSHTFPSAAHQGRVPNTHRTNTRL
jgi:hypothetical protein